MDPTTTAVDALRKFDLEILEVERFYETQVSKNKFSKRLYTYFKDSEIFENYFLCKFDQFIPNRSYLMTFIGMVNFESMEDIPMSKILGRLTIPQQKMFLTMFAEIDFRSELTNLERIQFFHLQSAIILNFDLPSLGQFAVDQFSGVQWDDLSKLYLKNTF